MLAEWVNHSVEKHAEPEKKLFSCLKFLRKFCDFAIKLQRKWQKILPHLEPRHAKNMRGVWKPLLQRNENEETGHKQPVEEIVKVNLGNQLGIDLETGDIKEGLNFDNKIFQMKIYWSLIKAKIKLLMRLMQQQLKSWWKNLKKLKLKKLIQINLHWSWAKQMNFLNL